MSNARNLARLLPNASGQLPDAAMSSGSVLQVVQSQNTTPVTINSSGYIDLGVSATITVQANSRIYADAVIPVYSDGTAGGAWAAMQIALFEGSTLLAYSEHVGTVNNEAQSYQIPLSFDIGSRAAGTYTFSLKANRVVDGTRYVKRDNRIGVLRLTEVSA